MSIFSPFNRARHSFWLPHLCQLPLRLSVACTETPYIEGKTFFFFYNPAMKLDLQSVATCHELVLQLMNVAFIPYEHLHPVAGCFNSTSVKKAIKKCLLTLIYCVYVYIYKVFLLQIIFLCKAEYYLTVKSILNPKILEYTKNGCKS